MKKSIKVNLNDVNKFQEFVNVCSSSSANTKAIGSQCEVDVKSLMGLFSLDLTKPVQIEIEGDDADELVSKLDKFVSEEE